MLKRIVPILTTSIAAAVGLILFPATSASAVSYGNHVNNCYGEYWNTDWNQDCDSPGASAGGTYETQGVCDYDPDQYVTVRRSKGSTDEIDGRDCIFSVSGAFTYYW